MAELSPPIFSFHLDNTLGALYIANVLASVLFGITSVQVYVYHQGSSRRDSRFQRYMIFLLWFFDALQLAFTTHGVYNYGVTNYADPLALTQVPWSFSVTVIFGDLSEVIVTAIFAYRIWRFGARIWPLFFILPPSVLGFVGATAMTVFFFRFPEYITLINMHPWLWYASFSVQAFADCAISVILCAMLIVRRTGFKNTNSLIRVLVLYSINTCALTSSVAVASIITLVVMPHNFVFIAFAMVLPKLMLNSLLALLNSRDVLRNMHRGQVVSIHPSKISWVLPAQNGSSVIQGHTRINPVDGMGLAPESQANHSDTVVSIA